jgi:RNA polymerase sigma factor (sigma-70 family)
MTKTLTGTQRALAARHLDLAIDIASRYRRLHPRWRDEIESAALAALVGTARRYDWTRGVPFAAYARRRIRGAIQDALLQLRSRPEQNNEIAIFLLVASGRSADTELEEAELIERFLEVFEQEDRVLVRRKLLDGVPFERLAHELGMSKTTLRKRLAAALGPGPARKDEPCTCKRGPS